MTSSNRSHLQALRRCAAIAAVLCAATSAVAQQAAATSQPAQPPPAFQRSTTTLTPTLATSRPIINHNGHITTMPGGKLMLDFQDAAIDSVLDELSRVAGFVIVKQVKPPTLSGRVTLVSRQPLTPDEAVSLLNTVLYNAGYAAIQQDQILRIVARDQASRLNIPVRIGADPTKIANTDELITQVIPLKSADATQLKTDLDPIKNPDAILTSNASSNALVITDTSANVRRMVQIVAALDQSIAQSAEVKVFQLQFATASSVAKLVTDLFGAQSQSRTSGQGSSSLSQRFGFFRGFGGGGPGGSRGGGERGGGNSSQTRQPVQVNASSDDRTNTVVVTGPPDTLEVIEHVVKELDSNPAAESTVFIYHLRNADALNVQDVINYLFNGQPGATPSRSNTSSSSGRSTAGVSNSFGSSSGGGRSGGLGSSSFGSSSFGSSSSNNNSRRSSSSGSSSGGYGGSSSSSQSESITEQVSVIADTDTNSLLVRTSPKNYPSVQAVLDDLDRPVPQVLIKVLVAEVTHDDTTDIGTELSALNLRASGNGQSVGTNFDLADATGGGLVAKVLESNFEATIRLLETVGKLDVLSRPYILASDNQEATIMVGQTVPIPTDSRVTDTGQTINSVEYTDIGIILDVTPHINPDGLVILDVNPVISSLSGQSVNTGPGLSAPIFNKRSADSRIAILDGKTIVIGGLMEDRKSQTVSKIPVLGDLPLIGPLFQRNQLDKTKTELLIFLTPHVAARPEELEPMTTDELRGTKLTQHAVEPGAFDDHMRGMQRGSNATTRRSTTEPITVVAPAATSRPADDE